jgi:hypothetical protein
MPDDRTMVTELATALGTLPHDTVGAAVHARPGELRVDDTTWQRLAALHDAGSHAAEFAGAFANGRAFLHAADGLRGRPPRLVEWTGGRRPPGDEVAPVDLRIDHVYLVSCKYLSRVIANPSPARLFDGLLVTTATRAQTDWYELVAPDEYRQLYAACRSIAGLAGVDDLPDDPAELTSEQRQRLRDALPGRSYPSDEAQEAYRRFCDAVATASAQRWRTNAEGTAAQQRLLWRLLRVGNAPYFLLGADARRPLRLRIASAWDWRETYKLVGLDIEAAAAGQPQVDFAATYVERQSSARRTVRGHVEVRWSHGRFAHPPEAKVYLDTPTDELPGYFPLEEGTTQPELWG